MGVTGAETVTEDTGAGLTVTTGVVAVLVSLVAVIVAVPTPTAVTVVVPFVELAGLTVSTAVLLETQVTVRPVRVLLFASLVVAVSGCVLPTTIGVASEERVTELTGAGLTVIEGVVAAGAVSLVAVIVAVPVPIAVTVTVAPLEVLTELAALTVSTDVLLDTQLTVRPESVVPPASFGNAVSTCVPPISIGVVGDESVTEDTGIGLTVITGVVEPGAVSLVAVIVAVPTPTAVTVVVPSVELAGLTVKTAVLLDTQLTVRPVTTLSAPFLVSAVSDCVPPITIGVVGEESVTVATGASVTVMEEVPVFPSLVAVIVTGPPAATAVTRPLPSTVATAALLVLHVTVRPVSTLPAASLVTAVSC
jgi:hypothetical protein